MPSIEIPTVTYSIVYYLFNKHLWTSLYQIDFELQLVLWKQLCVSLWKMRGARRSSQKKWEACSTFGSMRSVKPDTHIWTKWFANVCKPNAHMCGRDCEHALHHLRMVCIPFTANRNFAQMQRELGAPGVLCLPQVCGKLIYREPSANCLVHMWFACMYQP